MPLCQQKSPDPYENVSEQLDRELQSNQYLSQKLIDIINGATNVKTTFVKNEQPKYEHSHSAYLQAINTRLDADMQAAYVKTIKCMNIVTILLDIAYGDIRLLMTLIDIIIQIGEDNGIQFTQDLIRNSVILNKPECKNILSAIKVILINFRSLNTFLEQQQPLKDITNYSRFQRYHQLDQPEHGMYETYFQDPQLQYVLVNIYQLIYQHIDKKYNIRHFNDFTFQDAETEIMNNQDMKLIAQIPGMTDQQIAEPRIYALISIAQCFISKYHEDTIAGICIYMAHKSLLQGQNINIPDEEHVGILNKNLQINLWSFFDNLSKTPVMFEMLKRAIEPDKIQANRQRQKQCRKDELKLFLIN